MYGTFKYFEVQILIQHLKILREKNFWVYGFDARGDKNFTDINGKEKMFFYLVQKALV